MNRTKKIIVVAAIGLVAATSFPSCKSREAREEKEIKGAEIRTPEDDRVLDDARLERERTEYRFEQERRIRENEEEISELEGKIDNVAENMREGYRERIKDLREKNENMKEKISNYREETGEDWDEFKREFNHDMDKLGDAIRDFGRDNKK